MQAQVTDYLMCNNFLHACMSLVLWQFYGSCGMSLAAVMCTATRAFRNWYHSLRKNAKQRGDGAAAYVCLCVGRPTQEEALQALEAMEHGGGEAATLSQNSTAEHGRWVCWETAGGELCAGHLPPPTGHKSRSGISISPHNTLTLLPGEHVVQATSSHVLTCFPLRCSSQVCCCMLGLPLRLC